MEGWYPPTQVHLEEVHSQVATYCSLWFLEAVAELWNSIATTAFVGG